MIVTTISRLVAAALLLAAPAASAYRVTTQDGRVIEAAALSFSGDRAVLSTGDGLVEISPAAIDYYATFRDNVEGDAGNVIAFRTGSLFRFDTIDFRGGLVTIGLGESSAFSVPEGLVDFETSVLEGAMVRLPDGVGRGVGTSRQDSGDAIPTRVGSGAEGSAADLARRRAIAGRSAAQQRSARLAARRGVDRATVTRRGLADSGGVGDDSGQESSGAGQDFGDESDDGAQDGGAFGGGDDGGDGDDRDDRNDRDDRDDLNDRADDPGDRTAGPTGTLTVAVTSRDTRPIAGLQFQVGYPSHLRLVSPTEGEGRFIGFASGMNVMVNPGAPGRSPLQVGGYLGQVGTTVTGPGDFAQLVFEWNGTPADVEDLELSRTIAIDDQTTEVSDYDVELVEQ